MHAPNPEIFTREEVAKLSKFKESLDSDTLRERVGEHQLSTGFLVTSDVAELECAYCEFQVAPLDTRVSLCDVCFMLRYYARSPNLSRAVEHLYNLPCNSCGSHVLDGAELCPKCQELFLLL